MSREQPNKFSELSFRLKRLDDQIRIEFDLISHRMTWLMVSQSFLVSTFTQTLVKDNNPSTKDVVQVMQWLVPFIGVITSFVVGIALLAAKQVIRKLKAQRDRLEDRLERDYGLERLGVRVKDGEHNLGNLPSLVLPWCLCIVWVGLLILIAN